MKCEICNKIFSTRFNLNKHSKTIHASIESHFKCELCDKTFKQLYNLNRHIKIVHLNNENESFMCEFCSKIFKLRYNLNKHINIIHSSNDFKRFPCEECAKSFNERYYLNIHMRNVHFCDRSKRFACKVCDKTFNVSSNLNRHIKNIHSNSESKIFSCKHCSKTFYLRYNLNTHIQNVHSSNKVCSNKKSNSTNPEKKKHNKCPLCKGIFSTTEFTNHFSEIHDIQLKKEQLEFKSYHEFREWKKFVEEQETAFYVKIGRPNFTRKVAYYRCHRSGYYRGKLEFQRKRAVKIQGTSKIDSHCPASIKARSFSDGTIQVIYCSTHVGHKMELTHLPIPIDDRKILASKIAAKIPFETIISEVQTSTITGNLQRKHLVTKQDLRNIARNVSVHKGCVCPDDALGGNAWIGKEELVNKLNYIKQQHFKSMDICFKKVIAFSNDSWGVFSTSSAEMYTVHSIKTNCNCSLICEYCKVCVHKFNCTCIIALMKNNICKHIHLVCRLLKTSKNQKVTTNMTDNVVADHNSTSALHNEVRELMSSLKTIGKDDKLLINLNLDTLKVEVSDKFNSILSKVTCSNQIDIILNQLKTLELVLDSSTRNVETSVRDDVELQ